jgi:hypothetical protein
MQADYARAMIRIANELEHALIINERLWKKSGSKGDREAIEALLKCYKELLPDLRKAANLYVFGPEVVERAIDTLNEFTRQGFAI